MSIEKNKEAVRRWNEEIVGSGSAELFDEALAENYTNHSVDLGKKEFTDYCVKAYAENPNVSIRVDDMIAEGDKVCVRFSWLDDGAKVNGGIAYYTMADGKIVDDWFWTDHPIEE